MAQGSRPFHSSETLGEELCQASQIWFLKLLIFGFLSLSYIFATATGWTIRGSNPGRGEIFSTRPDRPWGLPSLLYNGYRVCFPGVKRPGRGVDHPPSSSARVKERVELYLYSSSGPSWSLLGRTLPYIFAIVYGYLCRCVFIMYCCCTRASMTLIKNTWPSKNFWILQNKVK
jgi:hypothetical protein